MQNTHRHTTQTPAAARSHPALLRTAMLGGGALLATVALAGCGTLTANLSDRWNVRYVVTASEGDLSSVQSVEYRHWGDAFDREAVAKLPEKEGASAGLSGDSWVEGTIVGAGLTARVAVTGATVPLTCEIVLEEDQVVARASAAPGEPLVCEAELPKFE